MFAKILLAVDGSESSLRAARVAADLVRAVKTERLRIVVAYHHIPAYLGEPNLDLVIRGRLQEAEGILNKALAEVGKVPAEIYTEMIEGSPAEAIINVAKTWNSNLVVMGSRGTSGITELVLGSTSHTVVSHAPCPVLIVR